jgi:biopolymer transport protein ExbD
MARKAKRKVEEAAIDMTPMLDVVFIMLIFFIVTTSFIKEAGVEIEHPIAGSTVKKPKASLLIGITSKGEVWIAKNKIKPEAVRAMVAKLRLENPEGAVVIQADVKAKSGVVLQVLDAVKAAGVADVSIAAKEE